MQQLHQPVFSIDKRLRGPITGQRRAVCAALPQAPHRRLAFFGLSKEPAHATSKLRPAISARAQGLVLLENLGSAPSDCIPAETLNTRAHATCVAAGPVAENSLNLTSAREHRKRPPSCFQSTRTLEARSLRTIIEIVRDYLAHIAIGPRCRQTVQHGFANSLASATICAMRDTDKRRPQAARTPTLAHTRHSGKEAGEY